MPTVETCLPLRKLHVCLAALFGASAAFAALPSGYTELQYIQGTGDAGAYICASDIYINPQTDKIVTTFEVGSLSSGNGYAIWCARKTYSELAYSLLWSVNGANYTGYYNKLLFQAAENDATSYQGRPTDPAVKDTVVTVTAESNSWHVVTGSGVDFTRTWPSSAFSSNFDKTGGPLFLFAMANGETIVDGYYSAHKLYSFKIYTRSGSDYTLSHDLIPVKRNSDGHVGIYDAAAGRFYPNSGNGAFLPGAEISEDSVVATNGVTVTVVRDWNTPVGQVWNFGSGSRPTVYVAAGKTLTINGAITGTSGFVKTGEGTLVLKGASPSFSGYCTVFAGKVRLEGAASSLTRCFRPKDKVAVPADYTKLDYLSLTGGGTASYIDIGYAPSSGSFGFFMDYLLKVAPASSDSKRIMGSSKVNGGLWGGLTMSTYCQNNTQGGQFCFGALQYLTKDGGLVANERMRIKLENGMAHLSRGWGYQFDMSAVWASKFYGNIYVGTINADNLAAGAPMDVYRFKVFDGSTLVHDFVPVQRTADGAVGLYDTFGNLGFRPAADAQYIAAGPAYSGSDSEWLEVAAGSGLTIFVR